MGLLEERVEKLIEWKVRLPLKETPGIVKESFSLQNKDCYLEFSTQYEEVSSSYLHFKCDDELHLPITVTLNVRYDVRPDYFPLPFRDRYPFNDHNDRKISIDCTYKQIWKHSSIYKLTGMVSFLLIFHADTLRVDRCNQTVSYFGSDILGGGLKKDFSKLFESGLNHDVVIKCDDISIKSHKLVLSARSEVFRVMLENDMLESQTGIIKIEDIDKDLLKDFIKYLYTDEMPELTYDKAKALYCVGHMYEVESLMLRCREYLQESISAENAYDLYNLADTHVDKVLKDAVDAYLKKKKRETPFADIML